MYLITLNLCDYESGRYKLMLTTVMMYSMSLMRYYSCSVNILTVYIITLSWCDHASGRYKLKLATGMFSDLCHRLLQATPAPACCAPSAPAAASHPTSGCCRRPPASLNSSPTDSASWRNVSSMFAVVCSLSYALCSLSYALCSLSYAL